MKHQDQPEKNTSGRHEEETNKRNNANDPGSQYVERDRDTKNDQGTQKTGNRRPGGKSGHNKRIRPLL